MSKEIRHYKFKDKENREAFSQGAKAGIPIGLGYFAVAFSLGIIAANAGISVAESAAASLLCNASAGEYAGFTLMAGGGTLLEMAMISFVVNARYMLMSSSMSQRVDPKMHIGHRMLMGMYITDEIFGVSVMRSGYMNPWFTYGSAIVASPAWALGTALGCAAGNIMPVRVVSALSVALYGMFLAIIIPPAKKERRIALIVAVSFVLSAAAAYLPGVRNLSENIRTIILTVLIAGAAAIIFPRDEGSEDSRDAV